MHYTYILKSSKNNKYYIGYTSNIEDRLNFHNSGKVASTRPYLPWELFYCEDFKNERDAINRERQIKSWKSRKAIERLKINKIEDLRFS